MPSDLAPLAPLADAAPLAREDIADLLADAPWQDVPSEEEIDAMYADWCARHQSAYEWHKDHHYW